MTSRASPSWRRTRAEPPRARRLLTAAVYVASLLAVVAGIGLAVGGVRSATAGVRYPVTADDVAVARESLAQLLVRGSAPLTGYDRAKFGQAWQDVDRNGCDTRNDVLARDLTSLVVRSGTGDCLILRGTLADPYSGREIDFVRGADTSAEVQIDHVVALADAWRTGAQGWSDATRLTFANDPGNLLAVDGELNQAKGASDAATWLPPHRPFRCRYVMRQVLVKAAYGLWVTPAERDAIDRELGRCEVVAAPPDEPAQR